MSGFRPEPGGAPDWFIPLIENWAAELAFAAVFLVIVFSLPAEAWSDLFSVGNKPDKEGKQ